MRKIPLRKCLATGEQLPKQQLIRIVRNKEGQVAVDPTGKMNGRGAYLKRSHEAFVLAKKKKVLARALQVEIPEEIFVELEKFRNNEVEFVIIASDASDNTKKKITDKCTSYKVEYVIACTIDELSSAIGKKNRVALGIQDTGFAKILKEKIGG